VRKFLRGRGGTFFKKFSHKKPSISELYRIKKSPKNEKMPNKIPKTEKYISKRY